MSHPRPATLGQLKETGYRPCSVKDELRRNVILKLKAGEELFPGIVGYRDSVIPQIVNGILSKHDLLFLGLRGQAKTRILRMLPDLLDEWMPVLAGVEINDDPVEPMTRTGKRIVAEQGDDAKIEWVHRADRYHEKLATPDVTIADLIGEIDLVKHAEGRYLSDESTMHFGLIPRSNRGLFAINELPDLAPRIQVGLFNVLEERDVQIRGYPIRLNLDVCLVFSANPEDYTNRGRIVTPLKDRIGSEIRTHYPETIEEGIAITAQEAWSDRGASAIEIPAYVRAVVEQVAFSAREDKKVDKRSGVSQRLPIATMELVVSNAERRALINGEKLAVPRISDIDAALPGITGKLELEYEGEMRGADTVVRDLIRTAVGKIYDRYFAETNTQQIEQWFNLGGTVKLDDNQSSTAALADLKKIQGLFEKLEPLEVKVSDDPPKAVAAAEFLLEGLVAHKKLSRSEERGFAAPEKGQRKQERDIEVEFDDWQRARRSGRSGGLN
jgi:magnesium chelatase subunit I